MALYERDDSFDRAKKTFEQAIATAGKQTREGPRTEYEAVRPSAGQFLAQGVGLLGTGEAAWKYGNKAYDWLAGLGAPDAAEQAATAGAGAAQAGVTDGLLGSVQLNTGAQAAGSGAAGAMNMGQAEAMRNIGPMAPEMTSGLGEGAAEAGAGAATQGQSALAWGPMAGSAIGGVAGSMGGKPLGQAIAGDTGGTVGGVVGGPAVGYLGSLAASTLASGVAGSAAGAAGGAAAGATAGSVVPGVGTLVGAGIGALTSLFF